MGGTHGKKLQELQSKSSFSGAFIALHKKQFAKLESMKCCCAGRNHTFVSTRNKPACGCIGPASIQGAKRNHYCALFLAGNDPGKYRETMLTLGKYHCRDIHEWEGGYCSFHPLSKCSCKKCDAQSGTKPLEKIHKTHIFNLNVGKQQVKTVSHTPPPPYNLAHCWNVSFNIEWREEGASNFRRTTDLREVVLFSAIFSTLLA